MTRHLIFDCDGVLIDSEVIAARVAVSLKAELGFPITLEEQLNKFVGLGPSSSVVKEELARMPTVYPGLVRERLWEAFRKNLKPMPGIVEVLESLARLDLPTCVASSSSFERLEYTLGLTGLWKYFEGRVFSGTQVPRGKPSPDLFLFAARHLQWKPENCLVVEDSVPGVLAARAAGMRVCGFVGGSHLKEDSLAAGQRLKEAGAESVISSLDTLRHNL
jgi:HAD superfamily hydrolase (TIGR01509 family)